MNKELKNLKAKLYESFSNQFKNYLTCDVEEKVKKGNAKRINLKTKEEIEEYRKKIKADFCQAVAGIDYSIMPLSVKESEFKAYKEFSASNLLIESVKNSYITANFYKPLNVEKPPAILFLCGHAIDAKTSDGYRLVCSSLAANGFAVLAVDTMGQGERWGYYQADEENARIKRGIFEHSYSGAKAWLTGVPLNHYFTRDYMTALNYLYSRQDIDNKNIGVTGSSGGGTATSIMALSQSSKIKAFAPAAYITEYEKLFKKYEAQDDEQIFYGLIDKGFNYDDILIAALPKPFCIISLFYDFFPADGAIDVYLNAKRFYEIYNAAENLELTIDNTVHGYSQNSIKCAIRFFKKHLMNSSDNKQVLEPKEIPCKADLTYTKSGMIAAEFIDARFVQHEIADLYTSFKREKNFNNLSAVKKFVKQEVFKNRKICDFDAEIVGSFEADDYSVEFFTYKLYKDLYAHAGFYSNKSKLKSDKYLLFFTDNGNSDVESNFSEVKEYIRKGYTVIVPDPINYGYLKAENHSAYYSDLYQTFGVQYNFAHHMFFKGDSICAFKVFEIITLLTRLIKRNYCFEILAGGKIEIPTALALLISNKSIPCSFKDMHEDYEKIIYSDTYDDYDIKSYILPGLSRYCNIQYIKNYLSKNNK